MRTIEEIKAHIEKVEREDCPRACSEESFRGWKAWKITALKAELLDAVTDGIPLSRLEEICNAERDGRCVVMPKPGCMPYPIGSKVYYIETDGVLTGNIIDIVVCGYSVSAWQGSRNAGKDSRFVICHNSYNDPHAYQLRNIYRTREEAEAAMKGVHGE